MKKIGTTCATMLALLGLFGPALFVSFQANPAAAQPTSQAAFGAPLMLRVDGVEVSKGVVLATLDGEALRLFGAFDGLASPWVQADLYQGDPGNGGTVVENLAIFLYDANALGGGFDRTVMLSPAHVGALHQGTLYVRVLMATADPKDDLRGQIRLAPASEVDFLETPLTHLWQGYPVARGSVRALPTGAGLRLVGYFHGLASNWQLIALYRGAHGTEGEQIASIFSVPGPGGFYAGFDHTLTLPEGWEQDLRDGLLYVEVLTSRANDGLRGQILSSLNQAPPASQMLAPSDGETIVVGGTGGADPVDPNGYLGTVLLSPVDDPDADPVGYRWQVSLRPDFNKGDETLTFDLGVDSTEVRLTAGSAAALVDALLGRPHGSIQLDTPVTVYHRALTTDGSRYAVGAAIQTTFVRGTLTTNDAPEPLPGRFLLHGNYPNPFNPSTTITFDLPAPAEVGVEVYNLLGQRVLVVPARALAAGAAQRVEIDAATLPSGSYLYRLTMQDQNSTQTQAGRMLLVK